MYMAAARRNSSNVSQNEYFKGGRFMECKEIIINTSYCLANIKIP
jgi:hypothetical protein